ncbi:MAG: NAD-dependent epimerase/dehydratase family protein [Bacteroidetes bacterium]|nr:NAD-dependent epimerase/dehydratase family protein [Bacteroidota bacterium]
MKILITGAAGFIGSHLTESLLGLGHEVIGIDNFDPFYDKSIKLRNLSSFTDHSSFLFKESDIMDKEALAELPDDIDMVIHLAAKAGVRPSIESPDDYLKTNIEGTQNIMNWMVSRQVKKILFAGSSSVYGNNKKVPFSEGDNVDFPISPYAYTKKACELLLHTYHSLYNISTLCLRFFTVYGPRQRPDLAIHKFTRMIYSDENIPMFGDGTTSRDYTFVGDTVDGVCKAVQYICGQEEPIYDIINLGNNQTVNLTELISTLFEVTGKSVPITQFKMQPGDVNHTFADISKAKALLGYNPKTNIKTGLSEFIKWYEKNKL